MSDTIFIDGLSFFKPREGAPEFVKGNISIQPEKLIAFLNEHMEYKNAKGYISIDLKKSKAGQLYCSLNTWKPEGEKEIVGSSSEGSQANDVPF